MRRFLGRVGLSLLVWLLGVLTSLYLPQPDELFQTSDFHTNPPKFPELSNPWYYLRENSKVLLILSGGGVISLGLMTLLNLYTNGLIHGIFALVTLSLSVQHFVYLLVPHSIFELPALWLAGAAGLKGPECFLRYMRGGKLITEQDLKEFTCLTLAAIMLVVIAAWVEANITLKLAEELS